jgi:hypothetical protein
MIFQSKKYKIIICIIKKFSNFFVEFDIFFYYFPKTLFTYYHYTGNVRLHLILSPSQSRELALKDNKKVI